MASHLSENLPVPQTTDAKRKLIPLTEGLTEALNQASTRQLRPKTASQSASSGSQPPLATAAQQRVAVPSLSLGTAHQLTAKRQLKARPSDTEQPRLRLRLAPMPNLVEGPQEPKRRSKSADTEHRRKRSPDRMRKSRSQQGLMQVEGQQERWRKSRSSEEICRAQKKSRSAEHRRRRSPGGKRRSGTPDRPALQGLHWVEGPQEPKARSRSPSEVAVPALLDQEVGVGETRRMRRSLSRTSGSQPPDGIVSA